MGRLQKHAVVLLLPLALAACAGDSGDSGPISYVGERDTANQPFPTHYHDELLAFLKTYLNNPVGALSSTVRRLNQVAATVPADHRSELERLLGRVAQLVQRIETNVAAIIAATKSTKDGHRPDLPPELANVQSTFVERLELTPRKEPP